MYYLTPGEQEMMNNIISDNRVCAQAAAYTIYMSLISNKKGMTPRDFHKEYVDNWQTFMNLEIEEQQNQR